MKITDVRASVHLLSSRIPLRDQEERYEYVVCEVETDEGHVGFGVTAKFLAHGVKYSILNHIKPAVLGMNPWNLEEIHGRVWPIISERGTQRGVGLASLSCVDLALWDILGKRTGQSVSTLLGGARERVPVYFTYGFGTYDKDELVQLARDHIAAGNKRLKILVGVSESVTEDAARLRYVRRAVGDTPTIAIDANESLSIDQALRLSRIVEDLDIAWFEDPITQTDPANMASLRARTTIPISGGQMDGHASRFREWLDADAIDILMPNPLFNGGMTEVRRVAALAHAYNKPLSDAGGGGIFCLHHVAGFQAGTLAERHMGVESIEEVLYPGMPSVENGMLKVPDGPGWGTTLNREMLKDTVIAS